MADFFLTIVLAVVLFNIEARKSLKFFIFIF